MPLIIQRDQLIDITRGRDRNHKVARFKIRVGLLANGDWRVKEFLRESFDQSRSWFLTWHARPLGVLLAICEVFRQRGGRESPWVVRAIAPVGATPRENDASCRGPSRTRAASTYGAR